MAGETEPTREERKGEVGEEGFLRQVFRREDKQKGGDGWNVLRMRKGSETPRIPHPGGPKSQTLYTTHKSHIFRDQSGNIS